MEMLVKEKNNTIDSARIYYLHWFDGVSIYVLASYYNTDINTINKIINTNVENLIQDEVYCE